MDSALTILDIHPQALIALSRPHEGDGDPLCMAEAASPTWRPDRRPTRTFGDGDLRASELLESASSGRATCHQVSMAFGSRPRAEADQLLLKDL